MMLSDSPINLAKYPIFAGAFALECLYNERFRESITLVLISSKIAVIIVHN
jgi:hypothetical protein